MTLRTLLAATAVAVISGAAQADVDPLDLIEPLATYKLYVSERTQTLVEGTTEFVAAVQAGDIDKAKALYPAVRVPYEEIEPIAELFSDLDVSIDSRADDYEGAEQDPEFPGFHRIEYALWVEGATGGVADTADKLLADVQELHSRIAELTFPPEKVAGGAAVLMEEVAATKISGEENRYSRTDLWDFKANTDGSYKVVELFRPLLRAEDPAFLAGVDGNFNSIYEILAKYEDGQGGYVPYTDLSDDDRNVLAAAINTLAEELSTVRGRLGLD